MDAKKPGSTGHLSAEDLALLNDEIAAMARAGLPLDQGLQILAAEMGRGRLRDVTVQLAADLQAGRTLPEALAQQQRVPSYYAGLITAGVRTGQLPDVLATLTTYARSIADLRAMVLTALVYPATVFVLAMAVSLFLVSQIQPNMKQIYANFRMGVPHSVAWMVEASDHWLAIFLGAGAALAVMLVLTWLLFQATEASRKQWLRLMYALPLAGPMVRGGRLAAFADLLAILVRYQVPLPESIRLAGLASSDPLLASAAGEVEADLRQGNTLGRALERQLDVPRLLCWWTTLGEKRGGLSETLGQIAAIYRRQTELRAGMLRVVLPAVLILVVAVFLSAVVFFTFLPILALIEGLSGGKL